MSDTSDCSQISLGNFQNGFSDVFDRSHGPRNMRQRIRKSSELYARVFDPQYAIAHSGNMRTHAMYDVPYLVKTMMEAVNGNQMELAERIGVSQATVSRWLNGSVPDGDNLQKILSAAHGLGIQTDLSHISSEAVAATLAQPFRTTSRVKLKGYVGAGSVAHFYAISDEDYEEVDAPVNSSDRTVAVEVKGSSFGPLMDSWLVYYDDVRSPVTDDLFNKICVVGLTDDRILLKKLKRERDGSITLLSNSDEAPIKNARIQWAAKVTGMRPR